MTANKEIEVRLGGNDLNALSWEHVQEQPAEGLTPTLDGVSRFKGCHVGNAFDSGFLGEVLTSSLKSTKSSRGNS